MKAGYKIVIVGILIYAGVQVKKIMDVTPYKERANQFMVLLKQNKPFGAQAMLSQKLQSDVSIEQIHTLILDQNLSAGKEISWNDWEENEKVYRLHGEILFRDKHTLPVRFTLFAPDQDTIMIDAFSIGKTAFQTSDSNHTGFLE